MENPVNYLIKQCIGSFITVENQNQLDDAFKDLHSTALMRINMDKVKELGEISLPSQEIWLNIAKHGKNWPSNGTVLHYEAFNIFNTDQKISGEAIKKFLEAAAKWIFPVERLQIQKDRCCLFLHRHSVMVYVFNRVLNAEKGDSNLMPYGCLSKNPRKRLQLLSGKTKANDGGSDGPAVAVRDDLSVHRADLIRKTLKRVVVYSDWIETNETKPQEGACNQLLLLRIVSVANTGTQDYTENGSAGLDHVKQVTVKCGLVRDPLTGKLPEMRTQEYLDVRSNDMRLMAMHKYGIRLKRDKFFSLVHRLGTAAVTVDLMEVKHSSPVQIVRRGRGSSTKGSAFILYNSARLETLLRIFDERVESGIYGPLPAFDEIDFTLLTEEEEWQLIYGYIFAFPNLIERCVEQLENGVCGTHLIVRFLSDFVSQFSVYYRRIRILTDKRDHMIDYVYARIYLIKAVREILNQTLALLDIQPVNFM